MCNLVKVPEVTVIVPVTSLRVPSVAVMVPRVGAVLGSKVKLVPVALVSSKVGVVDQVTDRGNI